MKNNLILKPIAIGSLPHNNIDSAINLIKKDFSEIPFLPQLVKISDNENMIFQIFEGMSSFCYQDYDEIIKNKDSKLLNKYKTGEKYSHAFNAFTKLIKKTQPIYAKIQIVGPYTVSKSLHYLSGEDFIKNIGEEFIIKFLNLKILWQINQIKIANPKTIPIVFIDEPAINIEITHSKNNSSANFDIYNMLKQMCNFIEKNNSISGIHCCAKPDWNIFFEVKPNIISFDAYSYGQDFIKNDKNIKNFLENEGKIAWGIVPTFDENLLNTMNIDILEEKFIQCVNNLTKNGLNEKLVIDSSLISSSCGAGKLSIESAQCSMDMVKELSDRIRKRFLV